MKDRAWSRSHLCVLAAFQVAVVSPCLNEDVIENAVDQTLKGIRRPNRAGEVVGNSSTGASAAVASVAVHRTGIAR